ncbi:MAG: twin-arginine translocase subunit TatC [Saprospiraceae bacterium]
MRTQISAGDQGEPKIDEKEMSFLDHLEDLRWHIVRSSVAIVFFAVFAYVFSDFIFEHVIFAHKKDTFLTYKIFCQIGVCMTPPNFTIIQTELGEQFFVALKVSFWIGFISSFPYIFTQFWKFIKPGLYKEEQKAARGVVFICSFLFLTGVAFGYFVMAPFAIKFLGDFNVGQNISVANGTSLSSYVSYLTMFVLPTGFLFQLPVLIHFLAKVGLVTDESMKKYRKHAFVSILVLAAIITPPDIITQFLIGVPVYFLYEISILIAKRAAEKREAELKS